MQQKEWQSSQLQAQTCSTVLLSFPVQVCTRCSMMLGRRCRDPQGGAALDRLFRCFGGRLV